MLDASSAAGSPGGDQARPAGVIVLGPAWQACGSYEVFKRQMTCLKTLGFRTYFLAVGPTLWTSEDNHEFWDAYKAGTTDLGADERDCVGRSTNFLKHGAFWTEVLPGALRSVAFWRSVQTRLMSVPPSLKRFVATHDVDTILCHHFFDMPLALAIKALLPHARLLLETQDLQTNHYVSQQAPHPLTRRPGSRDAILADEMELSGQADVLIYYNDVEAREFQTYLPERRHATIYPAFPRNYQRVPDARGQLPVFDFLIVAADNDPNYRSVKSFLLDAWSDGLEQRRSLKIAGSVDQKFRLQDAPLFDRFAGHFLGRVEDLAPLYHAARYVLLFVLEGQGIAIKTVEALSWGKHVVASPLAFRGFQDQVPETLASEIVATPQALRQRLLDLDVSGPPKQDARTIALYERLFTTERQTELYRQLLVGG